MRGISVSAIRTAFLSSVSIIVAGFLRGIPRTPFRVKTLAALGLNGDRRQFSKRTFRKTCLFVEFRSRFAGHDVLSRQDWNFRRRNCSAGASAETPLSGGVLMPEGSFVTMTGHSRDGRSGPGGRGASRQALRGRSATRGEPDPEVVATAESGQVHRAVRQRILGGGRELHAEDEVGRLLRREWSVQLPC